MTQVYKCDICGELSEFERNIMIGNKQDHFNDVCYDCIEKVKDFITDERENANTLLPEPVSQETQLENAKTLLKGMGYVVYRPPPTRKRTKK